MHVEIFTDRGSQNTLNEGGKKVQMNLWLPGGRLGGRDRELGMDRSTLLYLERITIMDLLYSTGNSA